MLPIKISKLIPSSLAILSKRAKHNIDYSKVPKLNENELEEQMVRGSGPGGQKTNKTNNCVVLKHLPTGLIVKCHESRLQSDNRKLARELLVVKLDNLINGENSVESQIKEIENKRSTVRNQKREKLQKLKDEWKARENVS